MPSEESQQAGPPNAQLKTLQRFTELSNRTALYHSLRLAQEKGVFDVLQSGPCSVEELAAACGTGCEMMAALVYLLCHLEVVERYGDEVALAAVMRLRSELDPDFGQSYWERLIGSAASGGSERSDDAAEQARNAFRNRMFDRQWTVTPSALELVRVLEIGTRRRSLELLDLGCGTGVWGLTLVHRDVQGKLTLVDRPRPIETAMRMAESVGIADRVTSVAGDFRDVELPTARFDLVLLANHLHLVPPRQWTFLLQRIWTVLRPRGEIAIVDIFEGQQAGDLTRNVWAVELSLECHDFRLCSPRTLQEQLSNSGFGTPSYRHLEVPPHLFGVMLAAKKTTTRLDDSPRR